jgi:hypothetical protein
MTAAELMTLLPGLKFTPFSQDDFDGFAGVETSNPMMSVSIDRVIIMDGASISVFNPADGSETTFELRATGVR